MADDSLATGRGLPRIDVDGDVADGLHVFGFDTVGIVADAALVIADAGDVLEPDVDGVAPHQCVAGLEVE